MVKVTHPAFGDDAFSNVMLGDTMVPNPRATPPTTIKDGAADFSVLVGAFITPPAPAAAATAGTPIAITFDGRSRIPVKHCFPIDERRDTIIRSRSLGASSRLHSPGVTQEFPGAIPAPVQIWSIAILSRP